MKFFKELNFCFSSKLNKNARTQFLDRFLVGQSQKTPKKKPGVDVRSLIFGFLSPIFWLFLLIFSIHFALIESNWFGNYTRKENILTNCKKGFDVDLIYYEYKLFTVEVISTKKSMISMTTVLRSMVSHLPNSSWKIQNENL